MTLGIYYMVDFLTADQLQQDDILGISCFVAINNSQIAQYDSILPSHVRSLHAHIYMYNKYMLNIVYYRLSRSKLWIQGHVRI